MKILDSQWADQRRDDLQGRCAGTRHAFRFADYAATPAGAELYQTREPVLMHIFADSPGGLIPVAGSPRSVSFTAVGLWDPGLKSGRWRTDYDNAAEGTAAAPLLLGQCAFATPRSDGYLSFSGGGFDAEAGCRYGETVFPRANAASSDGTWPTRSFWAVVANVEDAMLNPLCVNGPPGQSLPVAPPGTGEVFGLAALPDFETGNPDRVKMHMVLNSQDWSACRNGSYGGPYLAFAAQAERGNNGILTYLNVPGAPTSLRFGSTLMDIAGGRPELYGAPAGSKRYSQSHVVIEAIWSGIKRWLFIELVPDVRYVSGTAEGSADVHVRFNWHMQNSMLFPGADYLFKSASTLTRQCATDGVEIRVLDRAATYLKAASRPDARRDYSIDLQRIFDCLNRRADWGAAPMPAHPVPIIGIMFGIEQDDRFYLDGEFTGVSAPNALWIAVDSVRIE